jgi:hypothetical protein
MTTFKINGGKNPNYTILRTEDMLPATAEKAKQSGKEQTIYYMQGLTHTGKVSKEVLMCYRFNCGKFLKVF